MQDKDPNKWDIDFIGIVVLLFITGLVLAGVYYFWSADVAMF
jgi:hypothetical protein